jgi:hypothetical protein
VSAERYTGSGRRGKVGQGRRDAGPGIGEQRAGALIALTNVTAAVPEPPAEEHHLGDRLAGFVDGELGHDARERVQAHLATCPRCLAEAEDERSVKQLLAEAATPQPSSLLMARLMAVGAAPPDEHDGGAFGGRGLLESGSLGGSRLDGGSFGRGAGARFGTGGLGSTTPLAALADPSEFDVARDAGRTARRGMDLRAMAGLRNSVSVPAGQPGGAAAELPLRPSAARGRRFAFAAAGAFSAAAVALTTGFGGLATPGGAVEEPFGTTVSPAVDQVSPMNVPLDAPLQGFPIVQLTPTARPAPRPSAGPPGLVRPGALPASPLASPVALYLSSTAGADGSGR